MHRTTKLTRKPEQTEESAVMEFEEALDLVRVTIRRLSAEGAIPPTLDLDVICGATEIDKIGLDSLDKLNVVQELQRVSGISISEERIATIVTVGDLAQSLADGSSEDIKYHGGETFDLADVMLRGRQLDLAGRCALCDELLSTLRGKQQLVVMRQLLSPVDREVLVSDSSTHETKRLLMFGANSYLGLGTHPHVMERVQQALKEFGVGSTGTALLSGYTRLHRELEERIASLKGTEDAMLFSSGYSANVSLISALARPDDILIYDEFSHASQVDGIRMGGFKKFYPFAHNNASALARLEVGELQEHQDVFVMVEGVYSMSGDVAPLDELVHVCRERNYHLIVDDAHGTGVMGQHGRGTAEHFGVEGQIDVTVGTFSKVFAVIGGFVAASHQLIQYLRFFNRSYMFSTSLPPPVIGAVLGGLDVIEHDSGPLESLRSNIKYLKGQLRALGHEVRSDAPIIPLRVPADMDMRAASAKFEDLGIFVNSIEYPAVPITKQEFRISLMATHKKEDLDLLTEAITDVWRTCRMPETTGSSN